MLEVIEEIAKVEGIERIRLGSLEPRIITEEFVEKLSKIDKVCPHFHLSLQSGCDETLKRMNRKYTSEQFMDSCNILRKYYEEFKPYETHEKAADYLTNPEITAKIDKYSSDVKEILDVDWRNNLWMTIFRLEGDAKQRRCRARSRSAV